MCWLTELFKSHKSASNDGITIVIGGNGGVPTTDYPGPVPVPSLPFPEEPFDGTANLLNVNPALVMLHFLMVYKVPHYYWKWWQEEVVIRIDDTLVVPEQTNGQLRIIKEAPGYANSGVTAHGACHVVWQLLSLEEQDQFGAAYQNLKLTDEMVKLVFQSHPYAETNRVEAHAEIYRYLGDSMPADLKVYYPKLIKV